jgi:hypothetical protein
LGGTTTERVAGHPAVTQTEELFEPPELEEDDWAGRCAIDVCAGGASAATTAATTTDSPTAAAARCRGRREWGKGAVVEEGADAAEVRGDDVRLAVAWALGSNRSSLPKHY